MVGIVAGRKSPGSRPRARALPAGGAVDKGPGRVGGAVGAVGAGTEEADPARSLQGHGRGQGQLLVAAAFPLALQGDGGLPPARRQAGGATG